MDVDPLSRDTRSSVLRWLQRQLRQREPLREHLEAAVANDDVSEVRRIVARFEFSLAQRRHVARLLDDWEAELSGASPHDLDPPGAA